VTVETGPVATRERRLANLRATLARPGGAAAGPDQLPARAPFAGRRDGALARRLAVAIGAEATDTPGGWLVRRVIAPVEIPLDRRLLAALPGHPPEDAPLVCLDTETTGLATAAGTLAFLVGLARWDGTAFRQTQLLLPDHADEPAMLAEIERWVTPDAWLVSYNGRGFDWPLLEARFRLAGRAAPAHAGHLDLLPFVRRVFRHRMEDARLRTVEERLLGVTRQGDVGGWEIPAIYLDVLRGGPVAPLAGVVIHNEKDVRSLGLLLAHIEQRLAARDRRGEAPRGDLAGLARAYAKDRRHEEALACLDDALAAPGGGRDPFGRTPLPAPRPAPPPGRPAVDDDWWTARTRPDFGGRPPRGGWRGELANGRGGPLGPDPTAAAWASGEAWTDERLAAERARTLRRLGRWAEAVEAWQAASPAGGALGAIAWIEVAKLREHRLADPGGALAATRAAWRLLERSRVIGRPYPRVEADLARRGRRLAARIAGTPKPTAPGPEVTGRPMRAG
jgi:RNase_H superfamily